MTRSHPLGWSDVLAMARSRRLMRFRVTAPPTRFGIANPYRDAESACPVSTAVMARSASRVRLPSLSTLRNSSRRRKRRCFESPICVHIRVPLKRRGPSEATISNGQALATASASASQNRTSATGRHSSSETVDTSASALFGLIRSLGHGFMVANIDCNIRVPRHLDDVHRRTKHHLTIRRVTGPNRGGTCCRGECCRDLTDHPRTRRHPRRCGAGRMLRSEPLVPQVAVRHLGHLGCLPSARMCRHQRWRW